MGGPVRGKDTLCARPTITPYFLPDIIRSFREKYPGVELIIHEETTVQLWRALEEKELDLALISDAPPNPRIEIHQLFSEELFLCLPAAHPLVGQNKVVAGDLQHEKFILMQDGHCLGAQAQQFCEGKGFRPEISCGSGQIGRVLAMVQAGLAMLLIPELALRGVPRGGIGYRPFDGVRPRRVLVLVLP